MSEATDISVPGWPPGPGLPGIPVEFLEKCKQQLFPSMHEGVETYDHSLQRYIPADDAKLEQAIHAALKEKDSFVKALEEWDAENDKAESSVKGHKWPRLGHQDLVGKVRADISQQHTWDDVLGIIHGAQDDHNQSKGAHRIRRFFGKVADKKAAIEPWLAFIPDGDYTSIACGGIKFILGACVAAKKAEDKVMDLIEELPQKLESLDDYSELYRADPHLQIAAHTLYTKLLIAMEGIILYLSGNKYLGFFRPIFQQGAYAPLDDQISNIQKASSQVESAIKLSLHKRVHEVSKGVESIQRNGADILNGLVVILYSIEQNFTHAQQAKQLTSEPATYTSRKDLLCLLQSPGRSSKDADSTSPLPNQQEDIEMILHMGYSMDGDQQIRAEWLMANQTMRKGLRSSRSTAVIVDGNTSLDKITSLSFFCAMLARGLSVFENVNVLTHFCGRYNATESAQYTEDGWCGARLMLCSLTCQLISQWKYGPLTCLDESVVQRLEEEAGSFSLPSLWALFQTLVEALPPRTPLLILIDNISYYETDDLKHETKLLLKALHSLVGNNGSEGIVKVVVTAASRAMEVGEYFRDEEKVWIPESPEVSRLGFSESQLLQVLQPAHRSR